MCPGEGEVLTHHSNDPENKAEIHTVGAFLSVWSLLPAAVAPWDFVGKYSGYGAVSTGKPLVLSNYPHGKRMSNIS